MHERLVIDRLGQRGDGVAAGPVFIAQALAGEEVIAEVDGDRGRLVAIETRSPDRIEPFCPYFGSCGGCAVQHLAEPAYRAWKRGLVVEALSQAGVQADVGALVDAHGAGRRRASFHAKAGVVGFAEARSHSLVPIDRCPILVPGLDGALPAARALEASLRPLGKPLDFVATDTLAGIDLDIRGAGRVDERLRLRLADLAADHDLARLSIHGDVVIERRQPSVLFADTVVSPPPGAFLQATVAADRILAGLVRDAAGTARRVADLFSGCGTLAFALARTATVTAIDSDKAAIAALDRAAKRGQGLRPLDAQVRDLFHRPMLAADLQRFDAVILDPPRAGAEAQARRLAESRVPRIIAVSCYAATFARDAAILVAGGYRLAHVTPVDQFRHSSHVELVGVFER